ncbi:MAG TPA: anhydro-N-acetylmuramic acid kinase [Gemmatimonadaceae bacterium]|nr:anhydro-N-acetylmuramic acid kinase [Gemmatimonadaceae bacterium]
MSPPSGSASGARELFIGLMTGTSLDGVDAVLADCAPRVPYTLAHVHTALPPALRSALLALNRSGADEIHRSQVAAQELARLYAATALALLDAGGVKAGDVRAIGAHGQTVRHRPELGYTVQVNAPALLAELTGIDVVADFRSRDVAAGGQGAPLVPAFHRLVFGSDRPRVVVNVGGISNITALDGERVIGFDAGPGNVLIDGWMAAHFAAAFDAGGALAATASPDEDLVAALMNDPYFAAPPPKSTGRDLFTLDWMHAVPRVRQLDAKVVLASLTELTARAIGDAVVRWVPRAEDVVVCGGGAHNATLMRALQRCVGATRPVRTAAELNVPVDQVEALAFAWLAACHLHRRTGNVPEATGARGPRVLGALYPAA